MTKRKVHFKLDLQQFTCSGRRKYVNNNVTEALVLLSGMNGLSRLEKIAIINGTKKMINDHDNPNDGLLVDDNLNPYSQYDVYSGYAKPDTDLTLRAGWIADNGYFYHAEYGQHAFVVGKSNLSEEQAEDAGWIKLTEKEAWLICGKEPTRKQQKTLFDWCTANNFIYEHVLHRF
jgi:hypothetical protein